MGREEGERLRDGPINKPHASRVKTQGGAANPSGPGIRARFREVLINTVCLFTFDAVLLCLKLYKLFYTYLEYGKSSKIFLEFNFS